MAKKALENDIKSFENCYGAKIVCKDLDNLVAIFLLSFLPILDARRLKSKLPYKIMDIITDYLKINIDLFDSGAFPNIEIKLNEKITSFLKKHITGDAKTDDNWMHSMFRKNQTVMLEHSIEKTDKSIILTVTDAVIKKLPKSVDFGDEDGAFTFDIPNISFQDIAGHHIVKKRLTEASTYLKDRSKLKEFGVDMPKGMLLYGPPGTGKTMLAKAFAHETDLPFISTTGSEILNIELMKKIFKRAREYAPSIIFIDEIDAIGARDGSNKDIIINQFLTELDGFNDSEEDPIFVIAATNLKKRLMKQFYVQVE